MYILGTILGYAALAIIITAAAGKIYNRIKYHRASTDIIHRLEIIKANNRGNKDLVFEINRMQEELRGNTDPLPRGHV